MMAQGIPAPTLPYLTIDGKYMGKTTPIMRYISKQIGKYLADNDMDNQYLDSLADICMDWYMLWVDAHYVPGSSPETESKFHIERSPFFHTSFENVLSKSSGPYVLGEKVWRKKKRMNIK
jgi:hypothetical protein